jgi:hypothetical protein
MMVAAGWVIAGIMAAAVVILAAVWWDEWRNR